MGNDCARRRSHRRSRHWNGVPGKVYNVRMPPKSIFNLHFDIVHGCQLRCVGCPNSTLLPKVKRIEVEDFNRCLGNIDVDKVHTLRLFNFGEPLLHKNLTGIMACIPRQRWRASVVEISTNAQHVDWDDFEGMLEQEVLTRLVVSCDGDGSPEAYERLRPPSKWDRLIEFLERARALRDRHSPSLQLITRTVVENKEDMAVWRRILEPRGWTPEFRGWMLLPESVQNMTRRKPEIPSGACFFTAPPEAFTGHAWNGEVRLLYVDHDGTVVPCCMHPRAGVFGSLRTHRYSEILAGQARSRFIEGMEQDRSQMGVCGGCEVGPVGREGPSFHSVMTGG